MSINEKVKQIEKPNFNRAYLLEVWKKILTQGKFEDPYEAVLAELSEYFKMTVEEVRRRCLHWEDYSVEEWESKDRSTTEGILDFYRTQVSWIFDTMWYHARQYEEDSLAETVNIYASLQKMIKTGNHLDFGAGPGSSSLFFHEMGWEVSLADISDTMQDFAKWRFQQRGVPAIFINNSREKLPANSYNLITAFDVMVHIPNTKGTLQTLRNSLKPGGYLIFNIDNQPKTRRTASHLYEEQYPVLRNVRGLGFQRLPKITYFHVYQKVERTPIVNSGIWLLDQIRYNYFVTKFVGNPARHFLGKIKARLRG